MTTLFDDFPNVLAQMEKPEMFEIPIKANGRWFFKGKIDKKTGKNYWTATGDTLQDLQDLLETYHSRT